MNISGIHPYSGIYDYNSIQTNPIGTAQAVEAPAQVNTPAQENAASMPAADSNLSQSFGAYDYAQQYQPDATYEMKGADSDITSLDMSRAISDMQKDQVLQQYQFFVGESEAQDQAAASSTAMFRPSENFTF